MTSITIILILAVAALPFVIFIGYKLWQQERFNAACARFLFSHEQRLNVIEQEITLDKMEKPFRHTPDNAKPPQQANNQ